MRVNNDLSRGRTDDYKAEARELTWTQASKDALVWIRSYYPAMKDVIVFHAFKWNDSNNCTSGSYFSTSPISDLPQFDPSNSDDWRPLSGPNCLNINNESRFYVSHPELLVPGHQYSVSVIWNTNTAQLGANYVGQLTVDNYLAEQYVAALQHDLDHFKDFMVKFCYEGDMVGECP